MDALVLCYRGEPLREFPIDDRALEVGRGSYCDIVVHDAEVAERALLVQRAGGAVVTYDLASGGRPGRSRPMRPGDPVPLGRHHSLVRIPDAGARPDPGGGSTQPMAVERGDPMRLVLLVGRGSEARRVTLGHGPVTVGSADDNDVVLHDRTVSARHCRIEPLEGCAIVRDLGSRNGTWVDGVRVMSARIGAGAMLRLGRTDLHLVPRGHQGDARGGGIVAESPAMLRVLGEVERYAELGWPVLIQGDSGAGKEGIAAALHDRGPRAKGPFVALNAGGLPRDLVESELFGHERGAFTGAVGVHKGVFEQAAGGTLFLDEIGELPLELQARLLRVLETWEVRRVGGEGPVRLDVRLVCATHRDLRAMVAAGEFRRDLYYRITRLVIDVPPLRQRPGDIRALTQHFLEEIAAETGRRELTEAALSRLVAYSWPGNARELRNVLCAAAASCAAGCIDGPDVERALERIAPASTLTMSAQSLHEVVEQHQGNLSAAARSLGIPRSTLRDRLRALSDGDTEVGAVGDEAQL